MWTRRYLRIAAALFLGVVAVYLLLGIVAYSQARTSAQRASDLLTDLRSIRVGSTGGDVLLALRLHYVPVRGEDCTVASCVLRFRMDNTLLHRLGLAPLTIFNATVTSSNGKVAYVTSGLAVDNYWQPYVQSEEVPVNNRLWPPYSVRTSRGAKGNRALSATTRLTSQADAEQFRIAFNFNSGCLYRLGGCADAAMLAPEWWRNR